MNYLSKKSCRLGINFFLNFCKVWITGIERNSSVFLPNPLSFRVLTTWLGISSTLLDIASDLSPINTSIPSTVPTDCSTIFSMSFRFLSLTLKLQVSLMFLSDFRICYAISKGETLGIPSTESVR